MKGIGTVKERAANTFKISLKHVSRASLDFDNENDETVNSALSATSTTETSHAESRDSSIQKAKSKIEEVPSSQNSISFEGLPTRSLLSYWKDKEREVLQSLKNVYKPRLHQLNIQLRNPHLAPRDSDDKLLKYSSDLDASSDISTHNSDLSPLMSINSIGDGYSRTSIDYPSEEVFESQCEPQEPVVMFKVSDVLEENEKVIDTTNEIQFEPDMTSIKTSVLSEEEVNSSIDPPSQLSQEYSTSSNTNIHHATPSDATAVDSNEESKLTRHEVKVDIVQQSEIQIQLNDSLLSLTDQPQTGEKLTELGENNSDSLHVSSTDSQENYFSAVAQMDESSLSENHHETNLPTVDDSNTLSTISTLSPLLDIINQHPSEVNSKITTEEALKFEPKKETGKAGGLRKRDPNRIRTVGAVRFEEPIEELEESAPVQIPEVIIEESQLPIPTQCIFVDINPEINFIKDKLLGRGRYGQVYKCISRDSEHKFEVAGKFIRAGRSEIKKGVENEVKILQTLENHPQLVRFHSVYYMKREIAIFTELISGGELFERIANSTEETLTEPMVIKFVRQILKGIEFMHQKKIIHRDLKPENILCKTPTSFEIKIIDFGFATFIEEGKAAPKQLAGTTVFMAPETIKFEPQGYYTDIWSVGVIVYNLLCGFTPFEKPPPNHPRPELTDQEILVNIEKGQYDFEDEEFGNTSKAAKDFINKLLQVSPKKRPTASECLQHEWFNERKIQRTSHKVSRQVSLNRVRALIYLKKAVEVSALKK